jgi:hypothetical protein
MEFMEIFTMKRITKNWLAKLPVAAAAVVREKLYSAVLAVAFILLPAFSPTALAQTVTLNGAPAASLSAAVAAANAAGSGTITLSAGTFLISKSLLIDGNITVQGAPLDANGMPTSIITYDDTQPFDLRTLVSASRYLISVSNYTNANVAVSFTNVGVDAGTPTNGCIATTTPATVAQCGTGLGEFNYVITNTAGTISGTLTDCAAVGGIVGLVVNNGAAPASSATVTVNGLKVTGHLWGGVDVGSNALLIIGDGGIITPLPPGTAPDTTTVYGDTATAMVQLPGSTTPQPLDPNATNPFFVYIYSFDPNGGSYNGDKTPIQVNEYANATPPLAAPSADPTNPGQVFAGWLTDKGATWDPASAPAATANATIKAVWKAAPTPAALTATSAPALGPWMLALLAGLLAAVSIRARRKAR